MYNQNSLEVRGIKDLKKIISLLFSIIFAIITVVLLMIKLNYVQVKIINPKQKSVDEIINNGLSLNDENLSMSNGREDKFYYNQLSNYAKIIYDKLIENKDILKKGTEKINFTNHEFDSLLSKNGGMSTLSEEYQNAADAIRYDHVELYYVDFTKMALRTITYTRGNNVSYEVFLSPLNDNGNYLQDGLSEFDIDFVHNEVYKKRDEILENAVGSNYEKIKYVHNWLIDNIEYDSSYKGENTRNIYGAIIEGKVVCEGYSKAFKFLLDELEIPCIIVAGDAMNQTRKQREPYVELCINK